MHKLSNLLRETLARFKRGSAPKDMPAPKVRCTFCGQPGHVVDDCPNSAKFHVFSVDHDADEDGEGQ